MLVIVNPYATTVSDRLKNLVVYALRGRYDVDAVDTEAPRPRHRAVPPGRAARATTSSSRSAATAPSTRPPTGWSAPTPRCAACPAAAPTSTAGMLGIPTDVVDATEHLLAHRPRLAPAPRRRRPGQRALLPVLRRGRAGRQRRRARRRPPAAEGAPRRVVLRVGRGQRRSTAATSCTRRGSRRRARRRDRRRRHRDRPERRALHLLR